MSRVTAKQFDPKQNTLLPGGVYGFNRYVIDEKGKILIGSLSCASCHTRVLESGEVVSGAQGNVASGSGLARSIRSGAIPFPVFSGGTYQLSFTPWAPAVQATPADINEGAAYFERMTAGVIDRQGAAFLYPFAMPSLIGIRDIRYLDRTGLMKHNSPGDMMRYAAFNQGMDMLTAYNNFIPGGKEKNTVLPAPSQWTHPFGYAGKRYSDEQLYALTQYIYSLKPPKNPNRFPKSLIKQGEMVFTRQGCVTCHTPPLYTNNKLTPVNGFDPPAYHFKKYDIFNVSVGTDSVSALYSRRGTGYYKVPALTGVWYRSAFFHNGNLGTLEEVFDPARMRADFKPSGYIPPGRTTMAVKGHPFGLELNASEKKALIAFLKTR